MLILYIGFILLFLQNIIIMYYLNKILKNQKLKNINDTIIQSSNDNINLNNTIEPDISEINKVKSNNINLNPKKNKFIFKIKSEDIIQL